MCLTNHSLISVVLFWNKYTKRVNVCVSSSIDALLVRTLLALNEYAHLIPLFDNKIEGKSVMFTVAFEFSWYFLNTSADLVLFFQPYVAHSIRDSSQHTPYSVDHNSCGFYINTLVRCADRQFAEGKGSGSPLFFFFLLSLCTTLISCVKKHTVCHAVNRQQIADHLAL